MSDDDIITISDDDIITIRVTKRQLTNIRVACIRRLDTLKDREDMAESYNETREMLDRGGPLAIIHYRHGNPSAHAYVYTSQPAELAEQLESLVDTHGLDSVVAALGEVCCAKASHLESNWQDKNAAKSWLRDATKLGKLKIEN